MLRWTADDLAEAAGLAVNTVRRAESFDGTPKMQAQNLERIEQAFLKNRIATREGCLCQF
jgi:hypothetical protein